MDHASPQQASPARSYRRLALVGLILFPTLLFGFQQPQRLPAPDTAFPSGISAKIVHAERDILLGEKKVSLIGKLTKIEAAQTFPYILPVHIIGPLVIPEGWKPKNGVHLGVLTSWFEKEATFDLPGGFTKAPRVVVSRRSETRGAAGHNVHIIETEVVSATPNQVKLRFRFDPSVMGAIFDVMVFP